MRQKPADIPPRWITALFVRLCRPADVDDLLGDMEEMYREQLVTDSRLRANLRYVTYCWVLVFSYTVKKRKSAVVFERQQWSTQNIKSMYFNYLKMVLRRFRTRLSFSLINIFGLGLGLAACFLITLFVLSEKRYDRFHQGHERMYRLAKSYPSGGETVQTAEMRSYFIRVLSEISPGIEDYCRIKNLPEGLLIKSADGTLPEKRVAFADEDFFEFFTFPLLEGSAHDVLTEPYSVAISQRAALKYFSYRDAVGQVLEVVLPSTGQKLSLKVTGIYEDMPVNSHLHKDFIISASTGLSEDKKGFGIKGFSIQHSYFKLVADQSIDKVEAEIPALIEGYAPDFFKRLGMELAVQPMIDIHLKSNMEGEFEANGSEQYLDLLSVLAVFILLMAAMNYTNLATSQSLDRAKEVGVRKVMGSNRIQLTGRFMTEALTISCMGLILAAVLISLALPFFNRFSGQQLGFDLQQHWPLIPAFLLVTMLVGVVSGLYPSLYLSGFQAINSLKGKLSGSGSATRVLRKSLVVGQFAISAALMIATGIVFQQFDFMLNRDLGLRTEAIVNLNASTQEVGDSWDELKQGLLALPQVSAVSGSAKAPVTEFDLRATNGIFLPGSPDEVSMNYLRVDHEFFSMYEIPFIVGEGYDSYSGRPLNGIVLNRSAMQKLGFTEQNVLGQRLEVYDGYHPEVIGVTEDFHFESLRSEIGPVYFQWVNDDPGRFNVLSVKLSSTDLSAGIEAIAGVYEALIESTPFAYQFLDDRIAKVYQQEKYFVRTFSLFTSLAALMACLGALGLVMQLATSKRKEVGVRKVLGASAVNIARLMSRELLYLVLTANLIASPVAYLVMSGWLENFPYREKVAPGIFVLVLLASISICLLTIGSTAWKAAIANPVKALRSE